MASSDQSFKKGQKVKFKDLSLPVQQLVREDLTRTPGTSGTFVPTDVRFGGDPQTLQDIIPPTDQESRVAAQQRNAAIPEAQLFRQVDERAKAKRLQDIQNFIDKRAIQNTPLATNTLTTAQGTTRKIARNEIAGLDAQGVPIIDPQAIPLPQTQQVGPIATSSGEGVATSFTPTGQAVSREPLDEQLFTLNDLISLLGSRAVKTAQEPSLASGAAGLGPDIAQNFIDTLFPVEGGEKLQRGIQQGLKQTKQIGTEALASLLGVPKKKVTPDIKAEQFRKEQVVKSFLKGQGIDPSITSSEKLAGVKVKDPVTGKSLMFNKDGSIVEVA